LSSQWQTTWDRAKLFTSLAPSTAINFGTPGAAASADIVVTETTVYQTINGFGGTLSEFEPLEQDINVFKSMQRTHRRSFSTT
jgi:O-glycosyl hydrolase